MTSPTYRGKPISDMTEDELRSALLELLERDARTTKADTSGIAAAFRRATNP